MDKRTVERYLSPMKPDPTHLSLKGGLRPPVQCLLCDIYGTLLISGSGDTGVSRRQKPSNPLLGELLAAHGIKRSPAQLREDLYTAIEVDHRRKKASGIDFPEVEIDKVWASILPFDEVPLVRDFAVQWEMLVNPVWPMPGLSELITTCRDRGIAIGVISNAQFFTPLLFQRLLGADMQDLGFDPTLLFFSYQQGRAKPSMLLYASAVERLEALGIPKGRVAYIGNDMRNDIAPARRIGFQTILFAGDARSLRLRADDPFCKGIEPDLRITQLEQLTALLLKG